MDMIINPSKAQLLNIIRECMREEYGFSPQNKDITIIESESGRVVCNVGKAYHEIRYRIKLESSVEDRVML